MSILKELHDIDKLPTLPEILLKVLELVNSEKTDATALANVIEQDPALSSRVLRVANSSYYGSAGKRVSSVSRAVARLGFDEVRNIAVAVSIIKHFSAHPSELGYKQYWRHSLTAAFLNRIIAEKSIGLSDEAEKQQYFLAGLLHDIGILVLDQFFPEKFELTVQHAMQRETSFLQAEISVLNKETHPTIGAALLELWKLELPVISAIRFHHDPGKSPQKHMRICAAIALAEFVLCNTTIGSFEGSFELADDTVWKVTGMSSEQTSELIEYAETEVQKSDLILTLGEEPRGLRSI